MSVLVFIENNEGTFRKANFELAGFAASLAEKMSLPVIALSLGYVQEDELKKLGKHGIPKVLASEDERFQSLDNKAITEAIAAAAQKENAILLVLSHNNLGKAVAPRLSAKLRAGLLPAVMGLPEKTEPFTVKKSVYSGKAFARVEALTDKVILTLPPNSFGLNEKQTDVSIESFDAGLTDDAFSTKVEKTEKVAGKVLLGDAEVVVSAGRGMKGPENWQPVEELAGLLGAATACSRPVSDEGWRPHSEHVGQTGKIIAPGLYFALGISGAIQHLAGVNASKVIVAVNKDPEAPIFGAAHYGIVGDVFKVLPQFISEIKKIKE